MNDFEIYVRGRLEPGSTARDLVKKAERNLLEDFASRDLEGIVGRVDDAWWHVTKYVADGGGLGFPAQVAMAP